MDVSKRLEGILNELKLMLIYTNNFLLTLRKNCLMKIKQLYCFILSLISFVKCKCYTICKDSLKFDTVVSSLRTRKIMQMVILYSQEVGLRRRIMGSRRKVNHSPKVDQKLEQEALKVRHIRKKANIGMTVQSWRKDLITLGMSKVMLWPIHMMPLVC